MIYAGTPVNLGATDNVGTVITVNKSVTHQEIWGFGAAVGISDNAGSSGVNNFDKLSKDAQNKALDKLFLNSDDNLGLTIIRMPIRPDYFPREGVYQWDDNNPLVTITQAAQKRFPEMGITACPWTPPAWMKTPQNLIGGILNKENYEKYAQYLYAWSEKHIKDYGIHVKWITCQNEPGGAAGWQGCRYPAEDLDEMTSITYDIFRANKSPVMIGGPESAGFPKAHTYLERFTKSLPKMDFITTHIYHNTAGISDLSKYNKPYMQTETCDGKNPNNSTIQDGLKWGEQIHIVLNWNGNGYLYWWLACNVDRNKSLLNFNAQDNTFFVNKRGYIFGQFSRYLRPGDLRVDATSSDKELLVTAAKNPSTGVTSVVVTNLSEKDITATITGLNGNALSGRFTSETASLTPINDLKASGSTFTCTFPAKSTTSLREK